MKPIKNRTIIGTVCRILAVAMIFAIVTVANRLTGDATTAVRLKQEVGRGSEITEDQVETSKVKAGNTDNRINFGTVLENIVYVYSRSLYYSVSVGKIGKLECDFILRNNENDYSYVQVAYTVTQSKETENREYRLLESANDNYARYVAATDYMLQKRNGIRYINFLRLELLCGNGDYSKLLEEIKGYFLYMAEKTGTLWEHKDTFASCNHGFASYTAELI